MTHAQAGPVRLPQPDTATPHGLELRHLRYFAAVADAGTFTRAADQLFLAQPTLSQQIARLEDLIGAPLLARRRDGVRLTAAGTALLDAARDVLSRVDHGVNRTRQVAGLGRQRLRVVMPPRLPEALAVGIASALRSAAEAAGVDLAWIEQPLDAGFSPIRQHYADAGLGWLTASPDTLPAPLEAMTLGQFEPDLWIPGSHPAARRGVIGLDELARLPVIHGPRRDQPGTYDAWTTALQAANPRFAFTGPPLPHSLPVTLALAAAARPAAVLTGPATPAGPPPGVIRLPRPAGTADLARGPHRRRPADRHRRPGLARRPAPPAAADPLRRRRRPDPARTGLPLPGRLTASPQRDRHHRPARPRGPGRTHSASRPDAIRAQSPAPAPPEPAHRPHRPRSAPMTPAHRRPGRRSPPPPASTGRASNFPDCGIL